VKHLETFLGRRGWSTGLKRWEQELLFSAYTALETPLKDRKFGLDKITDLKKIRKQF
jgi:hypothetical protein